MIKLLPWDESGLTLLHALNTTTGKQHLGGVESEAKTLDRHQRYLSYHSPGETEMLRIDADGAVAGAIGYWATEVHGQPAYEAGWEIVPQFHRRGIVSAAASLLLDRLRPIARHDLLFAFPTPDNAGSNGICRKLGFTLEGVQTVEFPKGVFGPHNVWCLQLP